MKGKELLEKTLGKKEEVKLDTSKIFGGTAFISKIDEQEFEAFQKEKEKDSLKIDKKVKLLNDDEINSHYVNKVSQPITPPKVEEPLTEETVEPEEVPENPIEESDDIYAELFGNFEEFNTEEEAYKTDEMEEDVEVDPIPDIAKEVEDEVDEDLDPSNQQIKELTESDKYPENFPKYSEVLKLKKEHEDLIFVVCGNLFEQFHFEISPEIFIATTLKTEDYIFFKSKGGDETDINLWWPFLLDRCVLFPKIKFENVFDMPAGTVKKLVDNILINSRYQTSVEVIKL